MAKAAVRVAVVDDSAAIRELLRTLLGLDGRFELVGESSNGKDGVELVAELQPDVVLLDMLMPLMTGLEALPELRSRAPETNVVVFCSGGEEMEGLALAAGASAYRQKGSDLDALVELLFQLGVRQPPGPASPASPSSSGST